MARLKIFKNKSSIAVTYTLIIILIFVLLQTPLWLWFLFMQKDNYSKMAHGRAKATAQMIAEVSVGFMVDENYMAISDIVEFASDDDGLLSVRVIDRSG